jgi:hypothetical protein
MPSVSPQSVYIIRADDRREGECHELRQAVELRSWQWPRLISRRLPDT